MYSDVRQNSEDGSEYLVHEIRRKMNVISAEAQPSAGIVLFIFGLCFFFLNPPSPGFHVQVPSPHTLAAVPSASAYFMCLFSWLR